jgi:hypothetical protein
MGGVIRPAIIKVTLDRSPTVLPYRDGYRVLGVPSVLARADEVIE